jgi:hypothetical protein
MTVDETFDLLEEGINGTGLFSVDGKPVEPMTIKDARSLDYPEGKVTIQLSATFYHELVWNYDPGSTP